jgi:hypothetical protein
MMGKPGMWWKTLPASVGALAIAATSGRNPS